MARSVELEPEEWWINGTRYTAAFLKMSPSVTLYHLTGHFKKGHYPVTLDAGKAHTKKEALEMIERTLKSRR